jgi:type I restriction enzyme S subunit
MACLNTSILSAVPIEFPPLPEQRRIAEILDTLDEAIRKTEQVIAKLQQMKQGLLHDLLTRGIDENGDLRDPERHPEQFQDSPLGRIPKAWGVRCVREAGTVQLGRQRSPEHAAGPHMRPYLRVANVFDGFIDYSDVLEMNFTPAEQATFSLESGDILLNEGQSLELVGRCAVYDGERGAFCFQNTLIRFRPNPGQTDHRFARAVFKRCLDTRRFVQIAKQTTSVAHLGSDRFAQLPFPLPPLAEQQCIAVLVAQVEARQEAERFGLSKLRDLKQGLMDDLLTGRVRVRVPEEASA